MTGRTIGAYRIEALLGSGGMGSVYRGLDLMLDRPVAIKALRADVAASPQHVERFRQEARTLGRLLHPHVATLYALLRDGDDLYMVMEFVEGETFEAVLHRERRLPTGRALDLFDQALRGIEAAHRSGIVHRDVKPANFMLTPEGVVKVMDFGIARLLGTHRMTQTRHAIGTAEYMAPEQVRGREVDARTDVYALGVLLYEMLAGRLPFVNESFFETMQAHLQTEPPPLRRFAADVPDVVHDAVHTALAKDPAERHVSIAAFRDALAPARPTGALSLPSGLVPTGWIPTEAERPSGTAAPFPEPLAAPPRPEPEPSEPEPVEPAPSPPTVAAPALPNADEAEADADGPGADADAVGVVEQDVVVGDDATAPWPAAPTRAAAAPTRVASVPAARTRGAVPPTRAVPTRAAPTPTSSPADRPTVAALHPDVTLSPAAPALRQRLAALPRAALAGAVVLALVTAGGVWALTGGADESGALGPSDPGPSIAAADDGTPAPPETGGSTPLAPLPSARPTDGPALPGGVLPSPTATETERPRDTASPAQPDRREPAPRSAGTPTDRREPDRQEPDRREPDRREPDRREAEPSAPAAPDTRPGTARIVVRPFGDVYVDGERLARGTNAPVQAELAPGTHTVRASHPVFGDIERTVEVRPGRTAEVLIEFATPVDVTVVSDPANAEILLDGRSTGRYTPATISVPPGTHTVTARRDGYRSAERQVTVAVGRTPGRIQLTLSPTD